MSGRAPAQTLPLPSLCEEGGGAEAAVAEEVGGRGWAPWEERVPHPVQEPQGGGGPAPLSAVTRATVLPTTTSTWTLLCPSSGSIVAQMGSDARPACSRVCLIEGRSATGTHLSEEKRFAPRPDAR